ncbi:MAG: PQQ-like beta-propeller repeat protein [Bacteroidetes bacterium]|nr:PQQ-like beta-propeller repeat protein [Bacteroidota bacterium]
MKKFLLILVGFLFSSGVYFYFFFKKNDRNNKAILKQKKEVKLKNFILPYLEDSTFIFSLNYSSDSLDTTSQIYFYQKYSDDSNILCFRGNAQRSRSSIGKLTSSPKKIQIKWKFKTDIDPTRTHLGVWGGGTGWTGQPLFVHWKSGSNWRKNLRSSFYNRKELKEVIVGSLCGKVYFLELENGIEIRNPISIKNPIKGTISIDPRLNGNLYIGQGIKHTEKFGNYFYNMFTGDLLKYNSGNDQFSNRYWGAFDSNPLIDEKNQILFWPAENGLIYRFDLQKLNKEPIKFRYTKLNKPHQGIESSFGAYRNLGYFSDNNGNVFCLNLKTMKPVWYFDNLDDSDASMVVDIIEDKPFLYIGNEVDKQGLSGKSFFRKIDGLSGKEIWNIERTCSSNIGGSNVNNGGILATCLVGKGKARDLIITVFSRLNNDNGGEIVAVNKETGKEIYSIKLNSYSWSSPVDVYDKEGNMYFIHGDVSGNLNLYDGKTGLVIDSIVLEGAIESSPITVDNNLIIGTRGGYIYNISIK